MAKIKYQQLFFLAFVLLVVIFINQAYAAPPMPWLKVRSQNFVIVGNASENILKQNALKLEQFRQIFTTLFTQARTTSAIPTINLLFMDDFEFSFFKQN